MLYNRKKKIIQTNPMNLNKQFSFKFFYYWTILPILLSSVKLLKQHKINL